jgi:hypothetical protein
MSLLLRWQVGSTSPSRSQSSAAQGARKQVAARRWCSAGLRSAQLSRTRWLNLSARACPAALGGAAILD